MSFKKSWIFEAIERRRYQLVARALKRTPALANEVWIEKQGRNDEEIHHPAFFSALFERDLKLIDAFLNVPVLDKNLKGYDLEPFVANLLQAMGYRTILSPHGGDSGIDITAYKDELPPRIVVQVKSQDGDIKETTIQSLKGAMREGDYGLFVTLSNYTKNAQKYLDSTPIIRGINGTELVDLVLKYYDQLSVKYRKMIPLKMVYIPVPAEE